MQYRTATRPLPSERLRRTFSDWSKAPWWSHLLAIALLTGIVIFRYWKWFGADFVLSDELAYAAAFDLVARGKSPYEVSSYLYPSFFAIVGSWVQSMLGQPELLRLLRLANSLGVAATSWIAMAWLPWRWRSRLLAGAVFVSVAPVVGWGMELGNLSLAVSGLALFALVAFRRRTVEAGLSLGLAMAVKPIAPMAALVLAAHRPPNRTLRHLVAVAIAVALAAGLILGFPYLDELLAKADAGRPERTVTLHRLPHIFGFRLHSLWISAPLALASLWFARRYTLGPGRLVCLATTASLAVTPVVWSHTLIFAVPLEVLALQVAIEARRRQRATTAAGPGEPPARVGQFARFELTFVLLGVAAIQFAAGAHAIYPLPAWMQLVGAGLPAIAPACLTAYVFARSEPF